MSARDDVRLRISVVLAEADRYDVRLPAEEVKRGMQEYAQVREVIFHFDSGTAVSAVEVTAQRRKSTGLPLTGADLRERPVLLIPAEVRIAAVERLAQAAAYALPVQS